MKIAVFDHIGNSGGGARFIEQLLMFIVKMDNSIRIDYYCNPIVFKRENFIVKFQNESITVKKLNSMRFCNRNTLFGRIYSKLSMLLNAKIENTPIILGNIKKEIKLKSKGHDIAFFPWPFLIDNIDVQCPKVGVFHDLNFKYFFGMPTFSALQEQNLNIQIAKWLQTTYPIVSTNFMKNEIELYFPDHKYTVEVIHLAPLVEVIKTDNKIYADIEKKYKLKKPYLIYPTHLCAHKNIINSIAAIGHANSLGKRINMVFVGNGTQEVNGEATVIGLKKTFKAEYQNVFGLGYVSNVELNSLFDNCYGVISSSLYEAGNGPGLDGWARGKPVLMSNIPSFVEHIKVQNVRALTFDPLNYKDIAKSICYLIDNYDECIKDALLSKEHVKSITWENVAYLYVKTFKSVLQCK